MWDLSCPDWEDRIRAGRPLIPDLPLIESEADEGLDFFDEMNLPDVAGKPLMGDAAGEWFRDLVRTMFGSWDPVRRVRHIRDVLVMAPKGQSKTTYSAGLMLSVMLMNKRPRAEALFVGPTQAISDRAYEQAVGMIEESPDLSARFELHDHKKTIKCLRTNSEMKVKTFDLNILTGSILIFVLLDELHLLGRNVHTTKVLRQIRGGLDKTEEGQLLITTTQSDDRPAGAFREELAMARKIRAGQLRGLPHRPMLPVLYEFPDDIARTPALWQDPAHWPMVLPNLGRSVHIETLEPDWESERMKGEHAIRIWASQHLNIEIGVGQKTDAWVGADYWERQADTSLTLEELRRRSEVIVVGIDGGGLDDLFGLTVLGRCRETRHWLAWSHAWCHEKVFERRPSIASVLNDFREAGELTVIAETVAETGEPDEADGEAADAGEIAEDVAEVVELIDDINREGLLYSVSVDPAGLGELVDALAAIGVTQDGGQLVGAPQGYAMMNAIKTAERLLGRRRMWHSGLGLMDWAVGNLKIEQTATAIRATKQNAGDAKIDPVMALFNAVVVMSLNPEAPGVSVFDRLGEAQDDRVDERRDQIDLSILGNPKHPRFEEMRDRFEAHLARQALDDDFLDGAYS